MKGNHVKQRYDRTLINLTSFTGSDFFFFFTVPSGYDFLKHTERDPDVIH